MASSRFQSPPLHDWSIRQRAHQLLYPKQEPSLEQVGSETRRRWGFTKPAFWSTFIMMAVSTILCWAMPLSLVIAALNFASFTAFGASVIAQIWVENRNSQSKSISVDKFKEPSEGASLGVAKAALFMAKAGKLLAAIAYAASHLVVALPVFMYASGVALPASVPFIGLGMLFGAIALGVTCHMLMPRLAYRQAWLEDHYSASASAVEAPSVVNRCWRTISYGFNSVFRPGMEGPEHKTGYAPVDQDSYVPPRGQVYCRQDQRQSFLNPQVPPPQQEGPGVRERQPEMGAAL